MKYKDLVEFEPIETIIQLRDADKSEAAKELVRTYVISDAMAEKLSDVAIAQLQFERPADNKGVLVVGNYGTGKSHLMSVISAIAENENLLAELQHEGLAAAARPIAGKFKVIRTEIGASTMALRDIVVDHLEAKMTELGVPFTFPGADTIANHKGTFEDMMATFASKYPDHGLLFVVDELLDYLRGRTEQQLIFDLNFLREIGEVCKDLRFRFMAGVQEAIFDSDRFAFVSDSLRRVKDRFEQLFIARTDVKYVVAERLLKKTAHQYSWIKNHLTPFTKMYDGMNERLDEFVRLFPVHPDYIDTFEAIALVEQREVLKVLSRKMQRLLDELVPNDAPGLIAYDSYWVELRNDRSFRSEPEVRKLIDASEVLEDRVNRAFARPQYKDMAIRIIHGLSVHRLTTGDMHSALGATPEELRDALCLHQPGLEALGGEPSETLLAHVETVLREIHKTVNGQFISSNADNRQYYIDLDKTEDYDAHIETRMESLDDDDLNRGYYEALMLLMEVKDKPSYVGRYRIWQHEVEWPEHMVTRRGYLFMGTPNERSTAVPPRDFYIYFIQPFAPVPFDDEEKADELFFNLRIDDDFRLMVMRYAAAFALWSLSSGRAKTTYRDKSEEFLRGIRQWLATHVMDAFQVTHQGQTKTLAEWAKETRGFGRLSGHDDHFNFRDVVNAVSGHILSTCFRQQSPEYPKFSTLMTESNKEQAIQDALRFIASPEKAKTKRSDAVLDALELLDGDQLNPNGSRYARHILEKLRSKPSHQVTTRAELMEDVNGVEYFAVEQGYRLEPEWTVVVLAALVYSGDIVLAIVGNKFDATKLPDLVTTPLDELSSFRHVEPPKDWDMPALRAVLELVGLPAANADNIARGDDSPIRQLHERAQTLVEDIVRLQQELSSGLAFWGESLLDATRVAETREKLDDLKSFLESLQVYKRPGQLKNFRYSKDDVEQQRSSMQELRELRALHELVRDLESKTSYLTAAISVLSPTDPWVGEVRDTQATLRADISDPKKRTESTFHRDALRKIEQLKDKYIQIYVDAHSRARLDRQGDQLKSELLTDPRLQILQSLSAVNIMREPELLEFQNTLGGLVSCFNLRTDQLQNSPVCADCGFRPVLEDGKPSARAMVDALERRLGDMLDEWTKSLLDNLEDPSIRDSLALLKPRQRSRLEQFVNTRTLPKRVDGEFVQTLNELFSGLVPISVNMDDVRKALLKGGSPVTPEDMRARFEQYLSELLKGREPSTVRLVIE